MSNSTELRLPRELPYPITVVQLHAQPDTDIQPGTRLLTYSFLSAASTDAENNKDAPKNKLFGTWDSPIEGRLTKWNLKPGDEVAAERAKSAPAIYALEPCKHGIQMGGLCAICGKDMTERDFDASRATIQMSHAANGPTVSFEEAQRIERETADHLRQARRLSLIVDLDQTVVHATVDPTVGMWILEGEAWEKRQAARARRAEKRKRAEEQADGSGGSSSELDEEEEDEPNPNWEALKDVKRFRLANDSIPPTATAKGKQRAVDDGRLYYVKPRPGLHEFLDSVATKYEMHVYTMGTRAYAEEVCAAIDPDGKYFGGRLLSRDESGSMTQKSLERLFPVDTSMVVIIDDRADVWGWSANLVKVIPYDFFVGIGDINSAFLPKADPASALLNASTTATTPPTPPTTPPPVTATPSDTRSPSPPSEDSSKDALVAQNSAALESQIEERPLAKLQEELIETEETEAKTAPASTEPVKAAKPKHAHKALLNNDDYELQRIQKFLDEIHRRYYDAHSKRAAPSPSAARIIPAMRSETLAGVTLVFSSVIPLDVRPESAELWRLAVAFGAQCRTALGPGVTHLVAAKRGTQKVDAARRARGVRVVWLAWLTDSIARWARQDERAYLLDGPGADADVSASPADSPPPTAADQISSDPEPDGDDWDGGAVAGGAAGEDGEGGEGVVDFGLVAWDDVNDELEAFLAEDDSEDDQEMDEESANGSAPSSPHRGRKRSRSRTPSSEHLSPLAKRKRLAQERSGSRLKASVSAAPSREGSAEIGSPPAAWEEDSAMGGDDDDEGTEGEEEFDFLAGQMEEDAADEYEDEDDDE